MRPMSYLQGRHGRTTSLSIPKPTSGRAPATTRRDDEGREPDAGWLGASGAIVSASRQQPQRQAGEADHDAEHPVLGAQRGPGVRPAGDGAVVGEDEPGDVTGDERGDLDVPDRA